MGLSDDSAEQSAADGREEAVSAVESEAPAPPQSDEVNGTPGASDAAPAKSASGAVDFSQGIDSAQVFISAFLIVAAGLIAYANVFLLPFHAPDEDLFLADAALHRVATAPEAFDRDPSAPLTLLGYALNWQLFPESAPLLRAVSLLLHLFAAVMLYLVTRRLLPSGTPELAAMTSGLFLAVHPLAAGNLAFVSGRPGVQAAAFGLLALWAWLRAVQGPGPVRAIPLGLAAIAYAAAFASEHSAVFLPLLLPAIDAIRGQLRRNAPLYLGALTLFAALLAVRHAAGIPAAGYGPESAGAALAAATQAMTAVLSSAFVPLAWSPLPPSPAGGVSWPGALLLAAALVCGGALAARRQAAALALLGPALGALTLPWALPAAETLAPARLYLPAAALFIAVPWALTLLPDAGTRAIGGAAAAAVILACGVITFLRIAGPYSDPFDLWTHAQEMTSESPAPSYNLGRYQRALAQDADSPEAARAAFELAAVHFERARLLDPGNNAHRKALGAALQSAGRYEEAVPVLLEAVRHAPFDPGAALNAALAMDGVARATGAHEDIRAAVDWYRRAERLEALPEPLALRLATLLTGMGNYREAYPLLLRAQGEEGPLTRQIGAAIAQAMRMEEEARRLLAEEGRGIEGLRRRAERHALENQLMSAFYLLHRIVANAPGDGAAWSLLGYVHARMNAAAAFVAELGEAEAAGAAAWKELARQCAASGMWRAATLYLEAGVAAPAPAYLFELAGIAEELRQPGIAAQILEEAAERFPDEPEVWLRRADAAIAAGDGAAARAAIERAAALDAAEDALAARREQIEALEDATAPVRTIIQ